MWTASFIKTVELLRLSEREAVESEAEGWIISVVEHSGQVCKSGTMSSAQTLATNSISEVRHTCPELRCGLLDGFV